MNIKLFLFTSVMLAVVCAETQGQNSTWNGTNGTYWNNAGNWDTLPAAGSQLIFSGSTNTTTTNDFAAGTQFNLIRFNVAAAAFTHTGNSVTLGGDIDFSGNPVALVLHTINLDLILNGNRTIVTQNRGAIAIYGNISEDIAGRTLTKTGPSANGGYLYLYGNNSYSGHTTLAGGSTRILNGNALGTTAAGTTVINGYSLELDGNITVGPEPLTLNGTGRGDVGALRNFGGNNTWGGLITLAGNTRIRSSGTGTTLTLDVASGNAIDLGSNELELLLTNGNINIKDPIVGTGGSIATGNTETLFLEEEAGNSTFTGNFTNRASRVVFGTLGNYGEASALGTGGTNAKINLGLSSGSDIWGRMEYVGSGNVSSDRVFQVVAGTGSNTGGGGNITNNGAGTMVFTAATFNSQSTGTQSRTLVLGGNNTGNNTIQGAIQNNNGAAVLLAKADAGTWILPGNNSYTGNTTLNGGELRIQNATALGTTAGGTAVNANSTLSLEGGLAVGAEALSLTGDGVSAGFGALLNLGGNNSWAGDITVTAGATRINSNSGHLLFTGNVATNGTGNFNIGGVGDAEISGAISGPLRIFKSSAGAGTFVLSGNNTYTGGTTIANGTLQVAGVENLGAEPGSFVADWLRIRGGTLRTTGNIALSGNQGVQIDTSNGVITTDAGTFLTVDGVVSGSTGLTKTGLGTLVFNANNTCTGYTTVADGVLSLASGDAIPDTNTLIIDGGVVDLASNETVGTLILGNATQGNNTYGSSNSTATVQDDTYFSGTGILTVGDGGGAPMVSFAAWALSYNVTNSTTANDDADKFLQGEEYAFDLDPTVAEYGNVLASTTALSGGNVTLTLAFNGNSSKQDINYVVRRANNPGFTSNTVVGFWNGTANWTTSNFTYFANQTQTGAGDVKAINVNMDIPAATEPRQFLKVDIE